MALVQALAGQPLSIPCGNLSIGPVELSASQRSRPVAAPAAGQRGRLGAGSSARALAVALIVWHKDGQLDSPIFVADARGAGSFREAKQQVGADWLRGRARLGAPGERALPALQIDEASAAESGTYSCTIEFYKAPTQSFQVRVQVVGE